MSLLEEIAPFIYFYRNEFQSDSRWDMSPQVEPSKCKHFGGF
jgi:hypothetical protein